MTVPFPVREAKNGPEDLCKVERIDNRLIWPEFDNRRGWSRLVMLASFLSKRGLAAS